MRRSGRIPPPTHSWLRNVLRLPSRESPLTSSLPQLLIPFSLVIFPHFLFPSPPVLSLFPPRLPFSPSARLFRPASQARGRRVCESQTSQNACGQHKELPWGWGQICLNWICSLSPLLVFIIFFTLSWPVVPPSVAFSTLPHCESHFPLF